MPWARPFAWLVAGAVLLPHSGFAEPKKTRFGLEWTLLPGAERCVPASDLAVAVAVRMGRSVFVAEEGADLVIRGSLGPAAPPARWAVSMRLSTRDGTVVGTRDWQADNADCRALEDDLALIIALLLDPDADASATPPTPLPPAAPSTEPTVASSSSEPALLTQRSPPLGSSWRAGFGVGGAFSLGLVPGLSLAPVAELSLGREQGPVFRVHGTYWPERQAQGRAGQQATIAAAHGGLSCSAILMSGPLVSWEAGVRGELGAVWASGQTFAPNESNTGLLLLALAETRVSVSVGPTLIATSLAVGPPLLSPTVVYRLGAGSSSRESVFAVSPVVGFLQVIVGFRTGGS